MSNGTKNPGDAADATLTIMQADLDAAIAVVEAAKTDSVTVPTVNLYLRAPQSRYEIFPALVCVADGSTPDRSQGSNNVREHELTIEIILVNSESEGGFTPAEVLTKRVERILEAIEDVLLAKDRLEVSGTANCVKVYVDEVAISSLGDEGGRLEKRGRINFRAIVST